MEEVILVIHLILALSIIGLVLIQRSEGGGLGIGGGGGLGGLTSPKGAANALSRMTAICAAGFFCTSLVLGILAGTHASANKSILESLEQPAALEQGATPDDADMVAPSGEAAPAAAEEPPSAPKAE